MPDTTTIYITKGAETHGIRKARAVVIPQGLACLVDEQGMALPNEGLVEPEGFADTFEAAQHAAEMRIRGQIDSLYREIYRLEAIDLTKVREG